MIKTEFQALCVKMPKKECYSLLNTGTVLSVFCLLLYSAGFIGIELNFSDQDRRLEAVEEVISLLKHGMGKTQSEGNLLGYSIIGLIRV